MEIDSHNNREEVQHGTARERSGSTKHFLNILIVMLILLVGYFSYAFLSRDSSAQQVKPEQKSPAPSRVIQLDVLNGCGAKGVAARLTNFLRSSGFDVVEMKNYKTSHIPQTMVVDRVGNLSVARRVAASLGISEKNVIQQINPDYFVDVSVIIGEDYANLQSLH